MDYLIFGKNSNIIFFTTCAFLYCIADNVGFLKEKIYWYNVPKESANNFFKKKNANYNFIKSKNALNMFILNDFNEILFV